MVDFTAGTWHVAAGMPRTDGEVQEDELPKRRYRAVFISDIHLGTAGCQAEALLDFLKHHSSDYLVSEWQSPLDAKLPQWQNFRQLGFCRLPAVWQQFLDLTILLRSVSGGLNPHKSGGEKWLHELVVESGAH